MYIAFALVAIFALVSTFVGTTEWMGRLASRALRLGEFRLFSVNPPLRPRRALLVSVAVIVAPLVVVWALGLVQFGLLGTLVASQVVDVSAGGRR